MRDRGDACVLHQGGLGGVGPGHPHVRITGAHRGVYRRKHATHRLHRTIQAQLTQVDGAGRLGVDDLVGGTQDRGGQGQVEHRTTLGHISRGEVDHQPGGGPVESGVLGCHLHPVLGLFEHRAGRSHDGGVRDPGARIGLNLDQHAGHAHQGDRPGTSQAHQDLPPVLVRAAGLRLVGLIVVLGIGCHLLKQSLPAGARPHGDSQGSLWTTDRRGHACG